MLKGRGESDIWMRMQGETSKPECKVRRMFLLVHKGSKVRRDRQNEGLLTASCVGVHAFQDYSWVARFLFFFFHLTRIPPSQFLSGHVHVSLCFFMEHGRNVTLEAEKWEECFEHGLLRTAKTFLQFFCKIKYGHYCYGIQDCTWQ